MHPMPVLRFRNQEGNAIDQILDQKPGGDGVRPPLSVGCKGNSGTYLEVPKATLSARVLGSSVVTWYAYFIGGKGICVNGSTLEGVRALRHGDTVEMGGAEIQYLDFVVRQLPPNSKLIGRSCALKSCEREAFAVGNPVVSCPWCGETYHAGCWLSSERCSASSSQS